MKRLCKVLNLVSLGAVASVVAAIASLAITIAILIALMAFIDWRESLPMELWISLSVIIVFACLPMAWKYGRKKLVFDSSQSRCQSFLLWETLAFLVLIVLEIVYSFSDVEWPGWGGLCLLLLSLLISLLFPFQYCPDIFWKFLRGIGFAVVLVSFSIACYLNAAIKHVSYEGNDPAAFPRPVQWIGKIYVPAGATSIQLHGTAMNCEWSCQVTEPDFLKFKENSSLEFILVETPRNPWDDGPFPYYLYSSRGGGNGGGITLRYDITSEKLTGSVSWR